MLFLVQFAPLFTLNNKVNSFVGCGGCPGWHFCACRYTNGYANSIYGRESEECYQNVLAMWDLTWYYFCMGLMGRINAWLKDLDWNYAWSSKQFSILTAWSVLSLQLYTRTMLCSSITVHMIWSSLLYRQILFMCCYIDPPSGTHNTLSKCRLLVLEFRSDNRHITKEKQLNHVHANLQNAIERAFGVLEARFPIMKRMAYPFHVWDIVDACVQFITLIKK